MATNEENSESVQELNSEIEAQELDAAAAALPEAEGELEQVDEEEHLTEEAKLDALTADDHDNEQDQDLTSGPEVDGRSVYVGNVDYSTKPEELQEYFQACGTINRVTILCDKITGHPKGFAYIEFASKEAVDIALTLTDSPFKGRQLKVTAKRTNIPGRGRGRRFSRGGAYAGSYGAGMYSMGGFRPYGYGGYRAPRGRSRRAMYHPYY
eukprot:TRINITY_DN2634_c0_g1_i1.p1 TRINITY_DN2634_c0_g1~~TRINITY_DN2634_c0_g1_i1.p1  ORF type:complete len:210 (-),score=54.73 TRINITY_DN2634_c0_g1_i1:459-1088(-)